MNGFCKFYAQKCKFSIFSAPRLPIYYNKCTRTHAHTAATPLLPARRRSPTLSPPPAPFSPAPTRRTADTPFSPIFRKIKK